MPTASGTSDTREIRESDWTVGSIPPGTTRTLTIAGTVTATAGATIANIAEVSASSAFDFDSTPGNGAAGEDDYDTASFTVAGTAAAIALTRATSKCASVPSLIFKC